MQAVFRYAGDLLTTVGRRLHGWFYRVWRVRGVQWFQDSRMRGCKERRLVMGAEDVIPQASIIAHGTFLDLDDTVCPGKDAQFTVISEEELAAANAADDARIGTVYSTCSPHPLLHYVCLFDRDGNYVVHVWLFVAMFTRGARRRGRFKRRRA
jgi:hypothetical protein